jgi:hypothetical protein
MLMTGVITGGRLVRGLALMAVVGLALGARAGQADNKLPPGKDIVAKHIKAIGGKDTLLKHEYSHAKGTLEIPGQGLKGDLEVYQAKPDKMLLTVKIENVGEIRRGYDGKVAWSIDPFMGPQILTGKMAEDVAERARIHGDVTEPERLKSLETVGEEKYNGKDCYKVKVVHKSGKEETRFYDKKMGLQAGTITKQETPMGEVEMKVQVNEYKKFGDVLQAAKTTSESAFGQQVITITDVSYDKLDDKLFELPKEIKALVK